MKEYLEFLELFEQATYSNFKEIVTSIYLLYNQDNKSQEVKEKKSKYSKLNITITINDEETNVEEIELYINFSLPKRNEIDDFDLLQWWNYHSISKIAKDYLVIQSSSVPSENLFSEAGNIITDSRNRLSPETSQCLVCLKSWNRFFKNLN